MHGVARVPDDRAPVGALAHLLWRSLPVLHAAPLRRRILSRVQRLRETGRAKWSRSLLGKLSLRIRCRFHAIFEDSPHW